MDTPGEHTHTPLWIELCALVKLPPSASIDAVLRAIKSRPDGSPPVGRGTVQRVKSIGRLSTLAVQRIAEAYGDAAQRLLDVNMGLEAGNSERSGIGGPPRSFLDLQGDEAQLVTLYRMIRDNQRKMDLLARVNAMAAEGNQMVSAANPFAGKAPATVPPDSGAVPLDAPVKRGLV